MLTSSYVYSLGRNCGPLIQQAQGCSSHMSNAIKGMSSYWTEMGEEQFEDHSHRWIATMDQLKQTLSDIQSGLNNYAAQLYREEEQRRQEQERRQNELRQQQQLAAAKSQRASMNRK